MDTHPEFSGCVSLF